MGSVEGVGAHEDRPAQIRAMATALPDALGQLLSQSPSADGFLRRPSLSFVDVRTLFLAGISSVTNLNPDLPLLLRRHSSPSCCSPED